MLSERFLSRYFYAPHRAEKLLSFALLPFSHLYCLIASLQFLGRGSKDVGVQVISVGNLTAGGSGKTPMIIRLAGEHADAAVISRGYGRQSRGALVVSERGDIRCSVSASGDEAMVMALALPQASVIVAEKREEGIEVARALGHRILFLDDGFRHGIKKFDILLKGAKPPCYRRCIPSGIYRLPPSFERYGDLVLQEGVDFTRRVVIKDQSARMVLLTSIANPERLYEYLPDEQVIACCHFKDHHNFTKEEIEQLVAKHQPTSLLVTMKDYVKLADFGYPLSIMELEIVLGQGAREQLMHSGVMPQRD